MRKKSKAEKWIILETTIGCLFSLASSIVFFYFGNLLKQDSNENATWVFLAAVAFLLIIPIIVFLVYRRYFRR